MRVLVAEDEVMLADLIRDGLHLQGMAVDVVYDGDAAGELLAVHDYDVLVLDRDLPGTHGDRICRDLVDRGVPTRILMLTAAGALGDRVHGLEIGADDYLTKPFEYPELVARIRALARRTTPPAPPLLSRRGITLDTARRRAHRDDRDLRLTLKEFGILQVLLEARGRPVSAEELLERVWDASADPFTSAVRVTMSRLRAKLGQPQLVRTLPNVGYML
ncbi:response regulator transcription factor [Embleya sp. NBC_00896]|uniref:response regulator transcription factor n=1 Tax=Embleya sp. NBC_00896 TaxID=2975961 RepID=UPI0038666FCC|nr:response regulator transcription factor [Embleya sp. NBC_00896]